MAYLNTNLLIEDMDVAVRPSGELLAWPTQLDPIEKLVVSLSIHDPKRSLSKAGLIWRAIDFAFGFKTVNPLADPKLEALRRFAILSRRRGDALPASEAERLIEAGYSNSQMLEVRRLLRIEAMVAL